MRVTMVLALSVLCFSPTGLFAQERLLPAAPSTATSTATGFHDAYTRCQHALTAAKALLPKPTANQIAFYGIVRLHHPAKALTCTATVAVSFQFRSSSFSRHTPVPPHSSWVQRVR